MHVPVIRFAVGVFLLSAIHETFSTRDASDTRSRFRRVIGGLPIYKGQWPWLVSLRGKVVSRWLFGIFPLEYKTTYCGGSVINDRWIMTAAHCFMDDGKKELLNPRRWHVRFATTQLRADIIDRIRHVFGKIFNKKEWQQWEIHVDKVVPHPQYLKSQKWQNDIALVRLSDSVPSGQEFSHIKSVPLAAAGDDAFPATDQECAIQGWGCTSKDSGVSGFAQHVTLPVLKDETCNRYYGVDTTKRLCAGYTYAGVGICSGDSGSPLVCQKNGEWVQAGVASFTSRDAPGSYPGVFTRVSEYRDWINTVVAMNP